MSWSEHPDTLTSVDNLTHVYVSQARYGEAETLFKRALAGREKCLKADHPDTLASIRGLASLCESQGRGDEAKALSTQAVLA